ncbi:MAG: AI-2E family transporter [Porticoccaceae bacterium]|nr:MAG: AI-2E family transporter [Porticoccaceae bacterium]
MFKVLARWVDRYLGHEEAVLLALLAAAALALLVWLGGVLAPFFAALIIAFLLEGAVARLARLGLPRLASVMVVFVLFLGSFVLALVGLVPLVVRQAANLAAQLPALIRQLQQSVALLPQHYPEIISEAQLKALVGYVQGQAASIGEALLSFSVASLPGLASWVVYLVLVPIMVFFLLKDKEALMAAGARLLPSHRPVLDRIWHEMNLQMANYVRGKVLEILIVGAVSFVAFALLGLEYAALLALAVGLSVVVPYIGAAVVTVPVLAVGYLQWGLASPFWWLAGIYLLIQFLDGNVLVPLLFSEAVNLHPLTIILAVLVFGGIWGFWGVFFAIPLATLLKAVYNAWPRNEQSDPREPTP